MSDDDRVERRKGLSGRRLTDGRSVVPDQWMEMAAHELSEMREELKSQGSQIRNIRRAIGITEEGDALQGGMTDTFELTRSGKRLILILVSVCAGLYWMLGVGVEWIKRLLH